jgi:hypothetical protein
MDPEWTEWAENHPSIPVVSISIYLLFVAIAKFCRFARTEGWRFDFNPFMPRPWDAIKDNRFSWRFLGTLTLWRSERFKQIEGLWNTGALLFVALGFHHVVPHLIRVLWTEGLHYSLCEYTWYMDDEHTIEWYLDLFTVFKLLGLFDTVLLVGQNKDIPTGHWYRRLTGFVFSWHCYTHGESIYVWFVALECSVRFATYIKSSLTFKHWQNPVMVLLLVYTALLTECETDWTTIFIGLTFGLTFGLTYLKHLKVY